MKILIQRVTKAEVEVSGKIISEIKSNGILALVGIGKEDTDKSIDSIIEKLLNLRIFPDEKGRFDKSLKEISGELLLVPQFTLYADTRKGRRPEFFNAMPPTEANTFFEKVYERAKKLHQENKVFKGEFGADMKVSLINDGPVTILLEN